MNNFDIDEEVVKHMRDTAKRIIEVYYLDSDEFDDLMQEMKELKQYGTPEAIGTCVQKRVRRFGRSNAACRLHAHLTVIHNAQAHALR